MKKSTLPRLALNKETVRKLTTHELREVNGGTLPTRRCPTRMPGCVCTSTSNLTTN